MLVLVVGQSGAGKDTLLNMAHAALAHDQRVRFVRRVITRPAEAGGEDHEPVSASVFATRSFALQWQAHGLNYGIPADISVDLQRGRTVVANVSRGVIVEAAERYPIRIIEITAPPQILAERLAARGRENKDDMAKRLSRTVPIPRDLPIETIVNDRSPREAADRFVAALIRAMESVPPAQTPRRLPPG